jgi:[protein-PII] uridylyltransferase
VKDDETGRIKFSVFTTDKPGLFAKISGVFTLNKFNILNAQTYSWGKRKALDIFTVQPIADNTKGKDKLAKVEKDLNEIVDKNFNPTDLIKIDPSKIKHSGNPFRVEIDNSYSRFFTIIEVYSDDFPGLLFLLTDTLYRCGLDIRYSKTATHVDQMLDIFYVRNEYGEKVYYKNDIKKIISEIESTLEKVYHLKAES